MSVPWVNGEGPSCAQLMLIGEAPGAKESELERPFVGPSGQMVDSMLQEAGISRSEVYVTNVCKIRPPDNNLRRLSELGKTLADFEPLLWNEISTIQPNAILALGDLSLKTLTGKTGITHYRGSILPTTQGFPKVIPTIHPANLLEHRAKGMFKWRDKVYIQLDFNRAVEQSKFKDFRLPQRHLWICRDSLSLQKFIERNLQNYEVSVDIETFKAMPICIGLSFNKSEAVSIPLLDIQSPENPKGIGLDEMAHLWKMVGDILYDEKIKKIGQNFKFDQRILRTFGLTTRNFASDTMLKFHTLYPEFPKRLEFISSIFTEEPYYKSEGREFNPKKDDLSKLFLYNAKDAAVTKEVDEELEKELVESGLKDYYDNFEHQLHDLYYFIEEQGILHDKEKYKEIVEKYLGKKKSESEELNTLVGYEINADSSDQICNLLYNELHLPKRTRLRKDGKSSLTADEDALISLLNNVKMSEEKKQILRVILKCRGTGKTLGTYLGVSKNEGKKTKKVHFADSDARVRTSYLICGTESGRTSTNKIEPPVRAEIYGLAFQTITKHSEEGKDIRSIFIANEGNVLVEADQGQAESRIALFLATEYEQLALMDKLDIHTLRASWITGASYEQELTTYKSGNDINRQLGKHGGHANDNGVGKRRFMEMVAHLTGGKIEISEWKAGKIIDIINQHVPGIRNVFHIGVQEVLAENNRTFINPWGRRRTFYNRWGDELFKEAYADIKQSTVSGLTQRTALNIRARAPHVKIIYEGHDALLFELEGERLGEDIRIIKECGDIPIDFSKCSLKRGILKIPWEFQIGTRWSELRKM